MLSIRCCGRWGWLLALTISIASFCYGCNQHYLRLMAPDHTYLSPLLDVAGFLGIRVWQYYLFFYIGTLVRRHFDEFIKITDKPWVAMLLVVTFFAISATAHPDCAVLEYFRFNFGGVFGMLMVFTAFRFLYSFIPRHSFPLFAIRHQTSSFIKFVGTRTLDIYLIHYFFLPRFLIACSPWFHAHSSIVQFLTIMSIALIVLFLSLLVSYILRLSPFLAHYLFGAKRER